MSRIYANGGTGSGGRAARRGSNGAAVAALACGIIGLVLFNFLLGPLAIVFGGVALRSSNRGAGRRGMAWAGIVLGIIDILLLVIIVPFAHHRFAWGVG